MFNAIVLKSNNINQRSSIIKYRYQVYFLLLLLLLLLHIIQKYN